MEYMYLGIYLVDLNLYLFFGTAGLALVAAPLLIAGNRRAHHRASLP